MLRDTLIGLILLFASRTGWSAEAAPADKGELSGGSSTLAVPATPTRPVADTYHGLQIVDDYRWLEEFGNPEVRAWSDAQNAYARSVLDALPNRAAIARRISELEHARSPRYYNLTAREGIVFAMKLDPSKQQPVLVTLTSLDDLSSERVILDPNAMDPRGATAIDFYTPSLDAKKVAVSMSSKGSERGDAHLYEVDTGKELKRDLIPQVSGGTAGGSIAWPSDGTGFFYTRYPRPGERHKRDLDFYQQVYFHKLGSAVERDAYSLGKHFPRIGETQLKSSPDGKYVLAVVANGDGGDHALYLWRPRRGWIQMAKFEDNVTTAELGADEAVYVLSRANAPRGQILRVALSSPSISKAQIAVKQGDYAISSFKVTQSRIYAVMQLGGPSEIHVFDFAGNRLTAIPTLPVTRAEYPVRLPNGDDIYFYQSSYVTPSAWFAYSAADGRVTRTKLAETFPIDFSGMKVIRAVATSQDGTRVPLNIIASTTLKLDGSAPALLTGYGGYGISLAPSFLGTRIVWLEQGGVLAIANLRGGGEFGDEWHRAGNLTRKQNVFDDFYACAKLLVDKGYTNPKQLGIMGGSNGGLLMGAALTQHPEMYRAVVSHVGIYDMLRVETEPNGAFNVTEFGTVKDPEQFKALFAYSPYHHVKDGAPYPAVLFMTGANDPRVDPEHSRKMTARLQAATSSKLPVLLRTSAMTGHGVGTPLDARIAELSDEYAFFFAQLGVSYKAPPVRSAMGGSGN